MSANTNVARIQLVSYKIDELSLKMAQVIPLLEHADEFTAKQWKFGFSFRRPLFMPKRLYYVCGMDSRLYLPEAALTAPESETGANPFNPETTAAKSSDDNNLITVRASIAGIFAVENERLDEQSENALIKIQTHAILLPYLRATVTTVLGVAGFGNLIVPLFNVQKMAAEALSSVDIQIHEDPPIEAEGSLPSASEKPAAG